MVLADAACTRRRGALFFFGATAPNAPRVKPLEPGPAPRAPREKPPRARRSDATESGFTLVELIIVIAILGILAAISIPSFKPAPDKAREAVLKTDLHTMREALDQYFADKAHYPESLQTLVDDGYLRSIPVDPFTGSSSTWQLIYADEGSLGSENLLPEETAAASPGIFDVKSGSNHRALDGSDVGEW